VSSLSALSLISYPTEAKRVSTTETRSRVGCLVFCVHPERNKNWREVVRGRRFAAKF